MKHATAMSLTFPRLADAFRSRRLTPREHLEHCLQRIADREPTVRAFSHLDITAARHAADASTLRYRDNAVLSPIDGMPIGVKDIIQTVDMPTRMGSALYENHQPIADAESVMALRAGGAIILGKTHTTEFAIGHAAITTNPHAADRSPGGSSSGSAAGVASGMFNAALGTQTQGSILRPASYCGIVGYKPSWGMLSLAGVHPVSASHDHLGTLADSVDTAWRLAWWLSMRAPGREALGTSIPLGHGALEPTALTRVAVLRTAAYNELQPPEQQAFETGLADWRSLGVETIEPDTDPALQSLCDALDQVAEHSTHMVAYDMRWPYGSYIDSHSQGCSQKIRDMVAVGRRLTQEDYRTCLAIRQAMRQSVRNLSHRYDAMVLPSASGIAPKGLEHTGSRALLVYSSFLGLPACSLPLLTVHGLPLGIQLMGFANMDYRLMCQADWLMRHTSVRGG